MSIRSIALLCIAASLSVLSGCGRASVTDEGFSFTEDDVTAYRDLTNKAASGAVAENTPDIGSLATGSGATENVSVDVSVIQSYESMRGGGGDDADTYLVNNPFLNVRSEPNTTSAIVVRLENGNAVTFKEFVNGEWVKIALSDGKEGFVAFRYLSKVTSEERLEAEKEQFKNMYFVNYGYVNMRSEANQESDKLVEIPSNTILKPLSIEGEWAKVTYDGKTGYVSTGYIRKLEPNFIVRQDTYALPVLQYRLTEGQEVETLQALSQHVKALQSAGYTFITLRDFYDLLQAQQSRDMRLPESRVIVTVSGLTPDSLKQASNTLNTLNINATLFVETQHLGISGITEKNILTLMANGFDIQSATHTGDDLRAQTNAQVELELKQSRKLLEGYTRKPVFAVSYPQGGTNDRVEKIAADAGYLFALGDDADRSFTRAQFLRIPAMTVFASMSASEVEKFVGGK